MEEVLSWALLPGIISNTELETTSVVASCEEGVSDSCGVSDTCGAAEFCPMTEACTASEEDTSVGVSWYTASFDCVVSAGVSSAVTSPVSMTASSAVAIVAWVSTVISVAASAACTSMPWVMAVPPTARPAAAAPFKIFAATDPLEWLSGLFCSSVRIVIFPFRSSFRK